MPDIKAISLDRKYNMENMSDRNLLEKDIMSKFDKYNVVNTIYAHDDNNNFVGANISIQNKNNTIEHMEYIYDNDDSKLLLKDIVYASKESNTSKEVAEQYKQQVCNLKQYKNNWVNNNSLSSVSSVRVMEMDDMNKINGEAITIQTFMRYIKYPETNWKILQAINNWLYQSSSIYKDFIDTIGKMPNFKYYIQDNISDELNDDEYKLAMKNIQNELSRIDIKHKFNRMIFKAYKEGLYVGYLIEDDGYLTYDYYDLKFDEIKILSTRTSRPQVYFDVAQLAGKDTLQRLQYPSDIQNAYKQWVKVGSNQDERFYLLDRARTIVLSNSGNYYPSFPLLNLFQDIKDISAYKAINLTKKENSLNNYIIMEIPIDEKTGRIDKLLLTPDMMEMILSLAMDNVDDRTYIVPTLKNAEVTSVQTDSTDDPVGNVIENTYDNTGFSYELFNGSNSNAISYSMKKLETTIFEYYAQIEAWVNDRFQLLQLSTLDHKFALNFCDCTHYSANTYIEGLLNQQSTSNPTVTMQLLAMRDVNIEESLSTTRGVVDIYQLHQKWNDGQLASINTSNNDSVSTTDDSDDDNEEDVDTSDES